MTESTGVAVCRPCRPKEQELAIAVGAVLFVVGFWLQIVATF